MYSCLGGKGENLCSILDYDGEDLIFWDGHFPMHIIKKCSRKKLRSLSCGFASALGMLEVKRGEPVAILLPNFIEFTIAYFGILRSGGVAAPINVKSTDFEIETILRKSGIKYAVVLDKFYPLVSKIETLKHIIVLKFSDSLPFLKGAAHFFTAKKICTDIPKGIAQVHDFYNFLTGECGLVSNVCVTEIKKTDEALMLFSSGTTGFPKGIMHTHESLLENAYSCKKLFYELIDGGNGAKEIFLAAAPYFHIMGISTMLHLPLITGSKIVMTFPFPGEDFGKKILDAVKQMRVSMFVGPPKLYDMMIESAQNSGQKLKKSDYFSLKICISGASKISDELRARFDKTFDKKILEGYGMSEVGITHCQKEDFDFAGSVGTTLFGIEHKLINKDKDGTGEVLIKSRGIMKRYVGDFENEEVFTDKDGWLHTGDLGCVSKNGELFLTDRKKDLIKELHGENIYPSEIELVLQSHYLVKEASVIGRQTDDGIDIVAFVVLGWLVGVNKEDVKTALFQICRSKLSSIKMPKEINFVPELPKNIFGKILKKELK